jgi:hypothetical protein
MQNHNSNINKTLNFSRWSRKAYASFVSIGKIVKISTLKIEVAQGFIKKSKSFTEIQLFFKSTKEEKNNEHDETKFILIPIAITSIQSKLKDSHSGQLNNSLTKIFSLFISVSICLRFFVSQYFLLNL